MRETVTDTFLDGADDVVNVDITVEELRNRLTRGWQPGMIRPAA
jgi:K+-sensing histidine kinase KdpD